MRSLRARLILATATATALVLAVCGTGLFVAIRAALLAEFDLTLDNKARALAAMVEWDKGRLLVELADWQLPEFRRSRHAEFFQIRSDDGAIVIRSTSLNGRDLPAADATALPAPRYQSLTLPDGRPGRAISIAFHARDMGATANVDSSNARPSTLVLASETRWLDQTLTRIRGLLFAVFGAATVASAGLLFWIIPRGLGPINKLATRIAGVGDANLSERISGQGAPRELLPLIARLNELLARLDAAFVRERSLGADIAHELRTPLAGLETALEVASSQHREPEEYRRVIARCLEVTRRLHALIDNLLMLSRAQAGQLKLACDDVSIDELLFESWTLFEGRALERNLHVDWDLEQPCELRTDREKLRLVLHNLFDNAVSYCDAGGRIRVAAFNNGNGNGQSLSLQIANTGNQLDADQASQVFGRFWRGDVARSSTGLHCGLGLSVCKKMMSVLDGRICATSEVGGEFMVEISLPASKLHPSFMVPA